MIQIIIEAVKPIADASVNNTSDTLEILSKVNEFYDSSWTKLISVLAGSFTIFGVIVPLFIQHLTLKAS
ncbi:hypothetical protein [Flavobacterium humidisoli]|uniref:Uncharacterized protein n=1 Tax=Flavobacterium humidisoli TaxID=2937442 RepID=A0ABY4LND0_9FLAO|nr:hypothetical protein [Flavobacterium humidisoli]UPZ14520.1 hypothetical protein M0M44_17330 [Flavobacterium humidisoli]